MSFILQFTEHPVTSTSPAAWRAALQEVESGEKTTIATFGALQDCLASHGITLPQNSHDPRSDETFCTRCGALVQAHRGTA